MKKKFTAIQEREVVELRDSKLSWKSISNITGISTTYCQDIYLRVTDPEGFEAERERRKIRQRKRYSEFAVGGLYEVGDKEYVARLRKIDGLQRYLKEAS